tara:strand:+ start:456 stop:887 length:432 start_codon:yes stop_codon:yes gene_type:complete
MNHTNRVSLSLRHELEVRQVIDMANAVAMYVSKFRTPDVLDDGEVLIDWADTKPPHPSIEPMHQFMAEALPVGGDVELVLEQLNEPEYAHLLGVYIQVATPKMMEGDKFSWGYCQLQWIFGNTYEEAFTAACEWAKEMGHDYD